MDDRYFDQWTRSLARGVSRRTLLRGLAGGLIAGLVGSRSMALAGGCVERGKRCHDGGECCSGICEVDARGRGHCGSCPDRECPEKSYRDPRDCQCRCTYDRQVCAPNETCVRPTGCVATCNAGQKICGDACIDIDACCVDADCAEDDLSCTTVSCDSLTHGCVASTNAGSCLIDGVCYPTGTRNQSNDCRWCDPAVDPRQWVNAPSTTACGESGSCAADTFTPGGVCNGSGECVAGTSVSCAPFHCNPDGSACLEHCTGPDDCVEHADCEGSLCAYSGEQGSPCTDSGGCDSGHCVNGYCCDTSCADLCYACNLRDHEGTCWPVIAGVPCDDGIFCNGLEVCDGNGQCVSGTPVDCGVCQKCVEESPYCVADADQNGNSCGVDLFFCANGECVCPTGKHPCNDGKCHECCTSDQCPDARPICSGNVCVECAATGDCPSAEPICDGGICVCHNSGQSCTPGGSPTGCCSGRACNSATNTCCTSNGQSCVSEHECCPGLSCREDVDGLGNVCG